ncbi:MAG TPA: hypothetical protein VM053_05710 [Gemmatimonadaceae bacterium]|nr:hypothetical protein [Gemmatimonadaceae bacterium]
MTRKWTAWSIAVRTAVIDDLIRDAVSGASVMACDSNACSATRSSNQYQQHRTDATHESATT